MTTKENARADSSGAGRKQERPALGYRQYNAIALGTYRWRRLRGLLTLGDHRRAYFAARAPRGPYPVAMPEDPIRLGRSAP